MNKDANTELNLNFLNNYVLEDEIFLRIDKLQALCAAQVLWDTNEIASARNIRTHYAMVIEEQVTELRKLLNQLFT